MQRIVQGPGRREVRRGRAIFIGVVVLFLFSISTLVTLYTDLLWYREVGFTSVFWRSLGARAALGFTFGIIFFVFSFINLLIVNRMLPVYRTTPDPDDPLERYRGAFLPYVKWIAFGVAAFLGFLFGVGVTSQWQTTLLALNATTFGVQDAVFAKDLGFYFFRLPFLEFLYGWIISGLVVVILLVAGAHYLSGGIRPQSPGDRVTPQVKAHLSALIGLAILVRAWGYRLNQYQLLYSERGTVTGASYTDVNAELPALYLLIVVSVIVAVLFLVNIRQRGWLLPLAGAGIWIVIAILGRGLYPFVIERFSVEPSQLSKERPFIERNIQATRLAYGIDDVVVQDHPSTGGVTAEIVEANQGTIENLRLWDPVTLSRSYRQLQEIRTYYQFEDVDVDRYTFDGVRRQVMLSVRELLPSNVPAQNWVNQHLIYTHGYGVVASPTNEFTAEGEPSFLAQDIPPKTEVDELQLEKPGIYYGEGLRGIEYSLVRTEEKELDFGTPEGNQFTEYDGEGGVSISGFLKRVAFAWRFRAVNIAISGQIAPESKILYFRNVRQRVQLVAPFLELDGDPYPVVADGRVTWMIDAYTVSDRYPYSQRRDFSSRSLRRSVDGTGEASIRGVHNYIRNSVKATIDAYDGTIKLYVWDESDPVIKAWQSIFPDLFSHQSEMPESLQAHVRYPEDLFRIQSDVYLLYHMKNANEFFTREDQWVIPPDPTRVEGNTARSVVDEFPPYYILTKLPGSEKLEYLLILPVNPIERPNLVAYMAAKSDPDEYGQLLDFRFPKGRQFDGAGQIDARINQVPEISERLTLLDAAGSEVIFGNLLVLPFGESILYVQPLFLQAENSPIPELKHVILADADRVVLGNTLEESFALLLAGGPVTPGDLAPVDGGPVGDLPAEALRHLNAAEAAARTGDWATFGRELEAAREVLSRGS